MKNLSDLRTILGETMRGVLDGKVTTDQARAVALVAGEVNQTAKLEVDMAKATDGDFKGSGFLEVSPKQPTSPKAAGANR
ncbi:MAG TPA: hypothetical protein VIZ86_16450 [Pseudomonas sp.]